MTKMESASDADLRARVASLVERAEQAPQNGSGGDEGADLFAHDDAADVAGAIQVEDDDGKVIVAAHADGGGIHDLEAALEEVEVADGVEHFGVFDEDGVGVVDAVYFGALHDDVSFDFHGPEGGSGVGGEVGA